MSAKFCVGCVSFSLTDSVLSKYLYEIGKRYEVAKAAIASGS